jgi:hypothetical protein
MDNGADVVAALAAPRKQVLGGGPRVCAHCREAGRLTCSACLGVSYCSAACQKADWRAHRPHCRASQQPPPGDDAASVVFPAAAPGNAVGDEAVVASLNLRHGAGFSANFAAAAPANPHGARRFLVKVQAPLLTPGVAASGMAPGQPLFIYDEPRALTRMLHPAEPAFAPLAAAMRAHGVSGGVKAYLWAAREGAAVRVFTEPPTEAQEALARLW